MSLPGIPESRRLEMAKASREEMEAIAIRLCELIAAQPPLDLLGYIYGQRMVGRAFHTTESEEEAPLKDLINDTQFVLEYVHAVLAATSEQQGLTLDEAACAEIFECATKLKSAAFIHSMATTAGTNDGVFGPNTAEIEFRAKSNWILLRGNRYQVLEGEFYAYVLAPHDAMLRDVYGIGAEEIAVGFQAMADAVRTGHADAADVIADQIESANAFAQERGLSFETAAELWRSERPADLAISMAAIDDMLRGGICNISRHTQLPASLLADLSYVRGEETDFFATGDYSGTPLRTLPARKKPLIKLGDDHYAVDSCFARDSGYRALLYNLLQRRPDYKKEFEAHQKEMSEAAFSDILDIQLKGAKINQEVWYKDPTTHQWVENDILIRIDDVLLQVEAKAGAAASIASPATDFSRHVQSVQDLVIKAYKQCRRFFEYLNSADEVSIFERRDGKYVECDRIRRNDYRVLLPIGLTVESFSPFSAMCKALPEIVPILGQHAFLSMSIDDLFVLKRFLPTAGEFMHYLEVRQNLGAMKQVQLFDELDHLGAYITQNRADLNLADQIKKHNPDLMVVDGMSDTVDRHFEGHDWQTRSAPAQDYPEELKLLLAALDATRAPGWLATESLIRDYGEESRVALAGHLATCRKSLAERAERCFLFGGDLALFVGLQSKTAPPNRKFFEDKARVYALAGHISTVVGVLAVGDPKLGYESAESFTIDVPQVQTVENGSVFAEASRIRSLKAAASINRPPQLHKLGRNEPCWCGSGIKFKKCHGH